MRESKTHFDQLPVALVKKIAKEIVSAEIVKEKIVKEEIVIEETPKRKGTRNGHLIVPPPLARTRSNSAAIGRPCRHGI